MHWQRKGPTSARARHGTPAVSTFLHVPAGGDKPGGQLGNHDGDVHHHRHVHGVHLALVRLCGSHRGRGLGGHACILAVLVFPGLEGRPPAGGGGGQASVRGGEGGCRGGGGAGDPAGQPLEAGRLACRQEAPRCPSLSWRPVYEAGERSSGDQERGPCGPHAPAQAQHGCHGRCFRLEKLCELEQSTGAPTHGSWGTGLGILPESSPKLMGGASRSVGVVDECGGGAGKACSSQAPPISIHCRARIIRMKCCRGAHCHSVHAHPQLVGW